MYGKIIFRINPKCDFYESIKLYVNNIESFQIFNNNGKIVNNNTVEEVCKTNGICFYLIENSINISFYEAKLFFSEIGRYLRPISEIYY